jgi:hypothetical protein
MPTRPRPRPHHTPGLPVANPALAVPVAPASGQGIGGSIRLLGRSVSVGDHTVLDASGTLGGGEILVGGDWQGLNPNIVNAQFTYIAATAQLFVNAELARQGGKLVVWADDSARVYGALSARGGQLAGDGGTSKPRASVTSTSRGPPMHRPHKAGPACGCWTPTM